MCVKIYGYKSAFLNYMRSIYMFKADLINVIKSPVHV